VEKEKKKNRKRDVEGWLFVIYRPDLLNQN